MNDILVLLGQRRASRDDIAGFYRYANGGRLRTTSAFGGFGGASGAVHSPSSAESASCDLCSGYWHWIVVVIRLFSGAYRVGELPG